MNADVYARDRFVDSINSQRGGEAVTDTVTAQVLYTDAKGTTWVHVPGGPGRTPLDASTVEAVPDSLIRVQFDGVSAYGVGDYTNPSISKAKVSELMTPIATAAQQAAAGAAVARQQAENATASAEGAAKSAAQAAADAALIEGKAQEALELATEVNGLATQARDDASAANLSASDALSAARAAGYNLSDIERVVDTLNWVTAHGRYVLTADPEPQAGHVYYAVDAAGDRSDASGVRFSLVGEPSEATMFGYSLTADAAIDAGKTYYRPVHGYVGTADEEVVEGKAYYAAVIAYRQTEDESPAEGKTYYRLEGGEYAEVAKPDAADMASYYERYVSGYEEVGNPADGDVADYFEEAVTGYAAVEEPDASGLSAYYERETLYYELSLDEGVAGYVNSHLWQDACGLNLVADGSPMRAHLGTVDGEHPMGLYVVDGAGLPVAQFNAGATVIGRAEGEMHVELTASQLTFVDARGEKVAYINVDSDNKSAFYITRSMIAESMRVGDWAFEKRANGNLCLRWKG